MSTPYIKYTDNLLLTKNNLVSLCCCDPDVSGLFWEAIPCDLFMRIRHNAVCAEWDQCQYGNRQFVSTGTLCQGDTNKICECQLCTINGWDHATNSSVSNFIQIGYIKNDGATVNWTESYLELTDPSNGTVRFDFNLDTTLNDIFDWVNTIPNYFMNTPPSADISYYIIEPKMEQILFAFGQVEFDTKPSRLHFVWNNTISSGVVFNSNGSTFANNMQTVLQDLISTDVSVTYNASGDSGASNGIRWFETTFTNDLCGVRQPDLLTLNTLLTFNGSTYSFASADMHYGEYRTNEEYLQPQDAVGKLYYNLGSKRVCDYENVSANNPFGPNYFNASLQCCPQRGVTMGPNQNIVSTVSGYGYNPAFGLGPWWNINHTVGLPNVGNNFCYHLPPSYFVFGKPGKLTYNYDYRKELHVSQSENTSDSLPDNCTVELFIAQFHKDVPWGPFGSYYDGIEHTTHLAWVYPYNSNLNPAGGKSFLSSTYSLERYGYDYRPFGWMKTRGTWRTTEEIELYVAVKRPLPFYIGTDDWDDIDYSVEIDETTLINGLTIDYKDDPGCGAIGFYFSTSGYTVGDFVDAINSVKIKDYDCYLFAFCAGSEQARSVASNKIINVSCELFEQQVEDNGAGDPFIPGNDGPWQDIEKWGGCDIPSVPLSYPDMHALSVFNILYPLNAYVPQTYREHPLHLYGALPEVNITPPICRFFGDDYLPRYNTPAFFAGEYSYGDAEQGYPIRKSPNLWWTNIPGQIQPVINIRLNTSDANREIFDAYFNVSVSGRLITLEGSGTNVYQTGTIDTDKGGIDYLASTAVSDLNSLSFINQQTFASYNPVIATLDENIINDIFLDQGTYDDGSGGSPSYTPDSGLVPTEIDFSYKEPLEDSDPVNISNGFTSVSLTSWVRRRCGTHGEFDVSVPVNPYCVPSDATLVNTDINCGADEVYDAGWLVSYGCASFVCKTEWYVKSTRCGCSTVYRCDGDNTGSEKPHPVNQPGTSYANADIWGGQVAVQQPLFYMCEYNFHPECDIPFLIKVPFQVVFLANVDCGGFGIDEGSVGYENGYWGRWLNGDPSVDIDCLLGLTAAQWFCDTTERVISNIVGWCQYMDPSGPKVKEEDIPRTDPPTAIVAGRSNTTFCSIHPWNFRPENISIGYRINGVDHYCSNLYDAGCGPQHGEGVNCLNCASNPACAHCENWDRIENAVPLYDTGYGLESLVVLARPIVKSVTSDDVCGDGGCSRWDVTCATACCECFYVCNVSTECNDVIAKHPFAQITTFDRVVNIYNQRFSCLIEKDGPCDYTNACCYDSTGSTTAFGLCPLGSCDIKEETHVVKVVSTCGCNIEGCIEYTYTCDTPECPEPIDPCFTWEPAPPEQPEPYCYDCEDALIPSLINECCAGGCYSIGARNSDECIGLQDTCGDYFDEFTKFCSSDNDGNCGKYDAAWSYVSKDIYEGISTIDGQELRWAAIGTYAAECTVEYTTTVTEDGSYHVGVPMYTFCNVSTPDGQSYDYIRDWIYGVSWPCGYGNLGVSASGEQDSRFMGSEGCH